MEGMEGASEVGDVLDTMSISGAFKRFPWSRAKPIILA